MNIFTIFGEIAVNRAEAVRDIQTVERQAERTSERMEGFFGRVYDSVERLSDGLDRLGKRTTDFGKWVSTRLTVPITALGTVALNTAANFESAMNRVRALTGATGEELAALEEQAMELGRTTQFSASQAADAMGFLAMAGFDTNQILGAMPSVLQLAASAQLDMARAADITTNILTGYGMEVEELQRANDVLVKSFISANTDLVQLGEAFKYAGPVAKAAGLEFEETAALLSMMGNAGIQASMAGTSLRGAITRLLNPTKQIQDILAKYNVRVTDSNGRLRSMTRILEDLANAGIDAGDVMALFGQRAGPAMQALIDQGTEAIDEFVAMLEEAGGTAERVGEVQMQGLGGAVIRFKSAWEGLMLAISRSGPLQWATNLMNMLAEAVSRLADMNPEVLRFLTIMAGVAAALGPALLAIGQLTRLLGSALGVISNIHTAMLGLFTGPAAPFVIALGVLLAFGSRFLTSMDEVEEGAETTLGRVMDFIEAWGPRAVAGFRAVVAVVGDVFNGLRRRVGDILQSIGNLWFLALEHLGIGTEGLSDLILTVMAWAAVGVFSIWDTLEPIFKAVGDWARDHAETAWHWIVTGLDWVSETLIPFIMSLPGEAVKLLETAWEWTVNRVGEAWNWLLDNWDQIKEWARDGIDMAMQWAIGFAEGAKALWDQVVQWAEDGVQWIIEMYQRWAETVEGWAQRATEWAVDLVQRWVRTVEGWTERAVEWTVNLVQKWAERVEGWADKTVEWAVTFVQVNVERIQGWIDRVVEWTARIIDVVVDTASAVGRWFLGLIEGKAEAKELDVTVKANVEPEPGEQPPEGWGTRLSKKIQEWLDAMPEDLRTWVIEAFFNLVLPVAGGIVIGGLTIKALEAALSAALAAIGALWPTATGALGVALAGITLALLIKRMFFEEDESGTEVDKNSLTDTINNILSAAGIAWMTFRITKNPLLSIGAGVLAFAIKHFRLFADDAEVDTEELDRRIAEFEAERQELQTLIEETGIIEPFTQRHLEQLDQIIEQLYEQRDALKDVGDQARETASQVRELTNAQLLFIEALRQGASLEAAGALLGIGHWETRGLGGFAHIDPRTGDVVRGGAGEIGMMQVMPETGRWVHEQLLGLAEPFTPEILADMEKNIEYGVAYFLWQLERYQGDIEKAISAYNAGTATAANRAYVEGVKEFWQSDPLVEELMEAAKAGGEAVGEAWSQGLAGSKEGAEQAATQLAQAVADYLVGESPPPKGPLSDVDEGGEAVAESWVEAFLNRVEQINPEVAQRLRGLVETIGTWTQPLRERGRQLGEAFAQEYTRALEEAEKDHVASLERQLQVECETYEKRIAAARGFVDMSKTLAERFAEQWQRATERIGRSFERMIANVGTMWLTGEGEWRQILSSFLSSAISQILSAAFAAMGIAQLVSKAMANMWNPVGWIVIAGLVAALSALQRSLASQLKGVSGGSYPSTDAGGSIPLPDDASPTTPTPPSAGRQIAEITGASRDLLVDLLSPLARLDEQTGILQRIHSVLDERLPRFDTGLALAGVGASGPSVVIERIEVNTAATDAAGITDDLVWELERRLGGFMSFKARGGG